MTNRISVYTKNPQELRDLLGQAEELDASEVGAAAMALCDMVTELQAEIRKLKRDAQHANDVAAMIANGIQPD